jgi:4-amino-4-deoxy-L-arabinose transferase-like glycosyltransferase
VISHTEADDLEEDTTGGSEGGATSERVTRRRAHGPIRRRTGLRGAIRSTPNGLSPFGRRFLVTLVVVQILLIISVALVAVFQFHRFAPVDEAAHYSYIEQIADHGSLPILGKTEISPQSLAITQGTYPRPSTIDPRKYGLNGLSYEAFQPPLYYVLAVPAFLATSNYVDKIYAVRLFDVVLLLAAVALAGRLARVVLKDRWLIGWSMMLVFFALPGVVVRTVTISNGALALPLAVLFATELWIAWDRHSLRRLMLAGLVTGLCILTELELLALLPVLALVVVAEARRRRPRAWGPLAVALLIPFLVVAPWFAFNQSHYGMLTAGPIAVREQAPIINPQHIHFNVSQLPNDTANYLLDPTLPAEWVAGLGGQPALEYLQQLLAILIIPAGLALILGLGRRLWSIRTSILGLPWLLEMFGMWYIRYGEQWTISVRYLYPTLPILLTLVAMATETIRSRLLPIVVSMGATLGVMALWGYFIFYYTGQYALR